MYVSSRDVKQANLNTTREAKGKQTHTPPSPSLSLSLSILMGEGWSWSRKDSDESLNELESLKYSVFQWMFVTVIVTWEESFWVEICI